MHYDASKRDALNTSSDKGAVAEKNLRKWVENCSARNLETIIDKANK